MQHAKATLNLNDQIIFDGPQMLARGGACTAVDVNLL